MVDAGIGRLLISSLHQGIADVSPTRLEFYENWLSPAGMRDGRIGLAPLGAVLSFLYREESPANDQIVARAGRYAADWTFEDLSTTRRGSFVGCRRQCARVRPSVLASGYLCHGKRIESEDRFTGQLRGDVKSIPRVRSAAPSGTIPMRAFYASAVDRGCALPLDAAVRLLTMRPLVETGHYAPRRAAARSHRRRMTQARLLACLIAVALRHRRWCAPRPPSRAD